MLLLDKNLAFIKEKILQTGSALFHFRDNIDIPDSTYIVSTVDVDENGCIWLTLPFSWESKHISDNLLAADMSYYRKGRNFYLDIKGVAQIIREKDIIKEKLGTNAVTDKLLLLRFKIISANYTETTVAPEHFFQKYIHDIKKWWLTRNAANPNPYQVIA